MWDNAFQKFFRYGDTDQKQQSQQSNINRRHTSSKSHANSKSSYMLLYNHERDHHKRQKQLAHYFWRLTDVSIVRFTCQFNQALVMLRRGVMPAPSQVHHRVGVALRNDFLHRFSRGITKCEIESVCGFAFLRRRINDFRVDTHLHVGSFCVNQLEKKGKSW